MKLWDGAVTELLVDGTDVYAAGEAGIAWIDLRSSQATVIARSTSGRGLVLHDDRLFWAKEGEPSSGSKPSGSVHSAPRHGGPVTTYAASLPWPQALAFDKDRIYWSGNRHGGVWSIPLAGGCITTVVSTPFGCCSITWIHRTQGGLLFLQGDWMRNGRIHDMWLVPIEER